jgi:signal peptidase I
MYKNRINEYIKYIFNNILTLNIFTLLLITIIIRTFIFGLYQIPSESMETTLLVGDRVVGDKLSYWFRKPKRGEIVSFNDPTYKYSKNRLINFYQRYLSLKVSSWTKRLIAIPGDRIQGKIEDNKPVIYLNNNKLDETDYVNQYPIIEVINTPGFFRYSNNLYKYQSFNPDLPLDKQPFYNINSKDIVYTNTGQKNIKYPYTPQNIDLFDITLGENEYWVMGDNRLGSTDSREWGILDGKLIHGRIVFRIFSIDSQYSYFFVELLLNPISFIKRIRWSRCMQFIK